MDNLTHTLVGVALGELVDRALPVEADAAAGRTRRRALIATGVLASNFPDLDLVLTPLLAPPLGYLMHHRGHTHTLLYGLPQVALLLGLLWLCWPGLRRLLQASAGARRGLLATGLLGVLLHLGFDGLNVYGVHPFHPFDGRWLYGDLVFIIEPVFWTALGVAAALLAGPRLRWGLPGLLALALGYFAWRGFLQWGSLVLLALVAGAVALAARRGGAAGMLAGVAACLAFIGVQAAMAPLAREQARTALARLEPGSRVLDIPLSAFPANPLCWSFATVSEDGRGGAYAVRVGVLSLAPGLNPVSQCPARFGGVPDAPASVEGAALAWRFTHTGRIADLRQLQRSNCHFDAWTRFARVPSLADGAATDVRFGAPDQPNFSTLPYAAMAGQPCPDGVPAWGRPRADLLGTATDLHEALPDVTRQAWPAHTGRARLRAMTARKKSTRAGAWVSKQNCMRWRATWARSASIAGRSRRRRPSSPMPSKNRPTPRRRASACAATRAPALSRRIMGRPATANRLMRAGRLRSSQSARLRSPPLALRNTCSQPAS
ncbi:hypothetical protein B0920_02800 [Massilia sp. KIM]|nr:hypothetical protein B0920_02800 [Massilia sp. KIM]